MIPIDLAVCHNLSNFIMKVVRKYTGFEELTPTLLREFVEKIVIHESEALDGKPIMIILSYIRRRL